LSSSLSLSKVARRLDVEESDVWRVHEDAVEMKRRGEDVILLSVGDPDFRTPEPIIDNAISHMRVGRTHYSPALGELDLRRAVADLETRTSPHPCSPEEVAILPGATSAIHVVMNCLLNAGDEIIIVDPMYVGYPSIMRAIDARVTTVKSRADNGFEPVLEDIQAAVTSSTKVVFMNTPGNPTGTIIGRNRLSAMARFCYEHDIWLVCDEVYSMFTFEKPHISIRAASERLDNIVMIDGLSKSHAMSGWRMGWVVAPPWLIRHIGNYASMSLFGSPQFIQDAAAFALNNDEYYVREMCTEYKRRRDFVCQRCAEMPGIRFHRPAAGMFVMLDVSRVNPDDAAFAEDLLARQKVSVVPGSGFGESTRGHVRFSLTQPVEILREGCERLAQYLEDNSRRT
jgi:arginine:pyruvate transaminase